MLKIWTVKVQNEMGTQELSLFGERDALMDHLYQAGYQVVSITYDRWV